MDMSLGIRRLSTALLASVAFTPVLAFGASVVEPGLVFYRHLAFIMLGVALFLLIVVMGLWLKYLQACRRSNELLHVDKITQLHSRQWVWERTTSILDEARRYKFPVVILLLDINGLKAINDIYGFAGGDFVLQVVGARLKGVLRDTDVAGRYTDSAFLLCLSHTPAKNTVHLIRRLQAALEEQVVMFEDQEIFITMSIGGISNEEEVEGLEQMVGIANRRLLRAKTRTRNRVLLHD